jgi:archaemetzincin
MITWCFLQLFFSPTIHIQPLGRVSTEHIKIVEHAVKSLYGLDCKILPAKPHDRTLYAASGYRYDAGKILTRFKSDQYILVITEKDIAYYKSTQHPEWGILGLARISGKTCVVSTRRMGREISGRLEKVAVHELGHNFSLSHCTTGKPCLMKDARGTIKQVDINLFRLCSSCKEKISLPLL